MFNTTRTTGALTVATQGNLTEAESGKRDLTLLPALYRYEIEMATHKEQIELMRMVMQQQHVGHLFAYKTLGFVMQYVGEGLMRCIQVTTDERSLIWLSKYTETVHAAGGHVQLTPYTVLVEPELFAEQKNVYLNEADQKIPFVQKSRQAPVAGIEVA